MHSVQSNETKYRKLVDSAVSLLKSKGFDKIKADLDDYEKPATLHQRDGEAAYTPDLTAHGNGGKCYFEIVTPDKKGEENRVIGKWKLLSTLAQMRNGTFFLLVPRGAMRFATQVLSRYDIDADILKLQKA